jgi:hypothetical protein
MTIKVRIQISYIDDEQKEKYTPSEIVYDQTINDLWLINNNPDFLHKVIASFNGVFWSKE